MIYLDPELVLKSPWLWDEKTVEWASQLLAARAKDAAEEAPIATKDAS